MSTSIVKKKDTTKCQYCNPHPKKIKLVTQHWCRQSRASISYDKFGGFVESCLAPLVRDFGDFVAYPRIDRVFDEKNLSKITDTVLSNDGIHLFTGSAGGSIIHWNLQFCLLFKRWKAYYNTSIHCLAHRSCLLASCAAEPGIRIWDTHTNYMVGDLDESRETYFLEFSDSGDFLISCTNTYIRLWSMQSFLSLVRIEFHRDTDFALYRQHTLTILSTDGSVFDMDWYNCMATRRSNRMITGFCLDKHSIDLNCDCTLVAYKRGNKVFIMNWPDLELVSKIKVDCDSLCFHPCNPEVLAVSGIKVYNVISKKELYHIPDTYYSYFSDSNTIIKWTPDGSKIISVPSNDRVRLFDVALAQERCKGRPGKIDIYR